MKIALLGTKGIPNNYGGFEQFAEYLSRGLARRGHDVTVYNPHYHPYNETTFEGVKIKRVYSPEKLLGGAANFLYDFLCLKDALSGNYDLIYEAGYHSVAPSYRLLNIRARRRPVIVTNMDGLEWKRSKWNYLTRKLIKRLEKTALETSHHIISDNVGIQSYYKTTFQKDSYFIPYGADQVEVFNPDHLKPYALQAHAYHVLVARLEPENNIEIILEGYLSGQHQSPICVIGKTEGKYGQFLTRKYNHKSVRFLGGIYNKSVLDSIRHFSEVYFHGHSVGGTNPSLLEAMACQCFIAAHNNPFNQSVLENHALYFSDSLTVQQILAESRALRSELYDSFVKGNDLKIAQIYNWDTIIREHELLFGQLLSKT